MIDEKRLAIIERWYGGPVAEIVAEVRRLRAENERLAKGCRCCAQSRIDVPEDV